MPSYQDLFGLNPYYQGGKKKLPAISGVTAATTPTSSLVGQLDIGGIFKGVTGRDMSLDELSNIRGALGGITNPALGVSAVQNYAKGLASPVQGTGTNSAAGNTSVNSLTIPKTPYVPATAFNVNQHIVKEYEKNAPKEPEAPQYTAAGVPLIKGPNGSLQEDNLYRQHATQTYLKELFPNENFFIAPGGQVIRQSDGKWMTDEKGQLSGDALGGGTGTAETPATPVSAEDVELKRLADEQNLLIAEAERKSQQKKLEIQQLGQTKQNASKSFLAKKHILGRSITGAPVESGLGVMSDIKNKTDAAIAEEDARLQQEIGDIRNKNQQARNERLTALDALKQTEFENKLKLRADERAVAQGNKPIELSPGATLYDPVTGKAVFTAPEKKVAEKLETWGNEKNGLWQYDSATDKWNQVIMPSVSGSLDDFRDDEMKGYPDAGILPTDDMAIIQAKLKTSKIYEDKIRPPQGASDLSGMPTSYKEWDLAGRPGTYTDWVRKTGLRPLPPTQATTLSEGFQIPLVTKSIDEMLADPEKSKLFGPVEGLLAKNPWDVKHKTIDDNLRRASQVIGRYMEGGVLRKEDEEKYRRMLPQITDTPEVAKDKLKGVKDLLAQKSQQYLADYEAAGFDVSGFVGKLPGTESSTSNSQNTSKPTLNTYFQQHPEQQQKIESMIRDNPNLSDDDILQIIGSGGNPSQGGGGTPIASQTGGSVSYRHNNPLNIKYGQFTMALGATPGQQATDGGQFAKFSTVEAGLAAGRKLLQGPSYRNLTVDAAMKRWSNSGYGDEIVPQFKGKKIGDLTPDELNQLIQKMQQREGWVTA